MKKTIIALAALAALSNVAYAQSSVTIYGVVDAAVRYSNNVDRKDHNQFQVVDGLQSESRIGFKGSEDLGSGTKAVFGLEAGFSLSNGASQQNDRLFGRSAFAGLSNTKYGTLTVGRQSTLAYDFDVATDVYGYGSSILSGYKGALTGLRVDNSIKYVNSYGPVSFGLGYASGNQTGDNSKGSSYAVSTGYNNGPLDLRAVYQHNNDSNNGTVNFFEQEQKLAAIGGSYNFGATKVFAQYYNNKFDVTNQKNDIYVVGASYDISPKVTAKASYSHDKQKNFNAGNRNSVSGVLSYAFSPRTDVYTEVDYQKLSGSYSNVAYNLNTLDNPNTSGTGVSVGLRHKF